MLHRKTDEIFGKGLSNLESLLVWIGQEKYNFVRVVAVRLKACIPENIPKSYSSPGAC